jgi:ABC-type amino acid transport substrate-binding protein
MIKLADLLNEVTYSMYQTLVYVEFDDSTNITDTAQLIRGVKYVTVVNNKTDKEDLEPRGLLEIKVVTLKTGQETFELVKKEALASIPTLKKFKYSIKQLQKIEEI